MSTKFYILSLIVAASFNLSAKETDSIAKNLDFASGMEYWDLPERYPTVVRSDVSGSKTPNSIEFTNETDDGTPYFTQKLDLPTHGMMHLEIRARVKAQAKDSSISLAAFGYTKEDGKWIGYDPGEQLKVVGSNEWTEISTSFWVYERADLLALGVFLGGKGTVTIDYFEVIEKPIEICENSSHLDFQKECISLMVQNSLYKDQLDSIELLNRWNQFRGCDTSKLQVDISLDMVLKSIDSHSFSMNAENASNWGSTDSNEKSNILYTEGHALDKEIAYLSMPRLGSGDSVTLVKFADSLQNLIESLDHSEIKGWVLDLRKNGGGNCWPMLAGIGPILGEGVCGYFEYEGEYSSWSYDSGEATLDSTVMTSVSRGAYKPLIINPKVAVLVGDQTGSSGEIVALAFKNRAKSKLFGGRTARYTTGNSNFDLSDGSIMFLASSVYCDRDKNPYPDGFYPDVLIENEEEGDLTLEAAVEWLKGN